MVRDGVTEFATRSNAVRAKPDKFIGGQASFGYRWKEHQLVIDENEAPIRKLIYEMFLKYQRKKRVATELNNLGYRTRNGSKFSDTTIQRLLRNPTAKGITVSNYTKSVGKRKQWVLKPKEQWIYSPCPAMVSEELWSCCNEILDDQEKKNKPKGPRSAYLLAGFISCYCGKKMYVHHVAPVYSCKGCKNKIPVDDIDEIYLVKLNGYLIDPNLSLYFKESASRITEKDRLLTIAKAEHLKLTNKIDQLVNMRISQELPQESFLKHYRPLDDQLKQIGNHMLQLESEIDCRKQNPLSLDTIVEHTKRLFREWSNLPLDQKRAIVETVTEKIIIGRSNITISLSYLRDPSSYINPGTSPHRLIPALPFPKR